MLDNLDADAVPRARWRCRTRQRRPRRLGGAATPRRLRPCMPRFVGRQPHTRPTSDVWTCRERAADRRLRLRRRRPHRPPRCLVSLPSEDFLYLGDDANFPYGTKSADELRECVATQRRLPARPRREAARRRLQLGDDGRRRDGARDRRGPRGRGRDRGRARGRDRRRDHRDRARRRAWPRPATVEGGAYRRALERQGRALEVTEVAAPDLAPIIQNGFPVRRERRCGRRAPTARRSRRPTWTP